MTPHQMMRRMQVALWLTFSGLGLAIVGCVLLLASAVAISLPLLLAGAT
jgi:hypothetical protein